MGDIRDYLEKFERHCATVNDPEAAEMAYFARVEIERLRAELAERDKAVPNGLSEACQFLVDRLREAEGGLTDDDFARQYLGHVAPAVANLEAMLTAAPEARSEAESVGNANEIAAEALTQESMYLGRLADQALAQRNLTEGGLLHREAQRMLDKAARLREGENK